MDRLYCVSKCDILRHSYKKRQLLLNVDIYNNIIFADQVFIDPTFFGIFVCGPLQSLVVDVVTSTKQIFFLLQIYFFCSHNQ